MQRNKKLQINNLVFYKQIVRLFFLLLFLCFSTPVFSQEKESKKTIIGTAVASTIFDMCVWRPCAVTLLVRLENTQENQSRYAVIQCVWYPVGSLPDRGYPKHLTEKSAAWEFEAVEGHEKELKIERYQKSVTESGEDITEEMARPVWALLNGAEHETIPYGETVPVYEAQVKDCKLKNDKLK